MKGDDIKEQIEELRQEVRGLSKSIVNLRQDDMRKVFGDQFRPVLTDRIIRHYSQVQRGSSTERTKKSRERLIELVERSVTTFQQHGKQRALDLVDEFEKNAEARSSGDDEGKDRFEMELTSQIREYLQLSDVVFKQNVPEGSSLDPMGTYVGNRTLSPENAERLLAPLSNARRVQVMLILSRENSSLAELCKEMELQKGHLQFHLRSLLDVEYIAFDRKSRLYALSPRGKIALEGITKLVESLH
jgi:hypothetical protein